MSLKFDPSVYLQAFTQGQNRNEMGREQEAQALNAIPQGLEAVGNYQDKQQQGRMQELLLGQKFSEAGLSPDAAFDYYRNGSLPSSQSLTQTNPNPPSTGSLMSSMRPGQGLEASAGVSDMGPRAQTTPTPITQSPVIAAWNQRQQPANVPSGPASLFNKKPVDYNNVIQRLQSGDATAFSQLNEKDKAAVEKLPAYVQMKKKEGSISIPQASAVLRLSPDEKKSLEEAYPEGFIPQDHFSLLSGGQRLNASMSEKEDQFNQREWDKIVKDVNPLTSTSRSTLGLATKADYNANRALTTLSKPVVTNQEAGNVMADIASIYQGGSATEFGMSHQAYNTLYGKIQNTLQMVTGKPQDALPNDVKQRLIEVLNDMKTTNKAVIKQAFDSTEKSKKKVISHFSQEWKDLRAQYEGGVAGGPENTPGKATHRWNPQTGQVEVIQ